MMLSQLFARSLCLFAVLAARPVASADETLPTPRSIILATGQEQAAQPMILAARRYAAFWNTGEARYAEAGLAQNFVDRTLPSGRPQGLKGVLEASKNYRVQNGQISDNWHLEDNLSLMQQLGVVKP